MTVAAAAARVRTPTLEVARALIQNLDQNSLIQNLLARALTPIQNLLARALTRIQNLLARAVTRILREAPALLQSTIARAAP